LIKRQQKQLSISSLILRNTQAKKCEEAEKILPFGLNALRKKQVRVYKQGQR
jgi:hypothetical protein